MDFSAAKLSFHAIGIPVSQLGAQASKHHRMGSGSWMLLEYKIPQACISSARAGLRHQQLQAASAETFPGQERDFYRFMCIASLQLELLETQHSSVCR